MPGKSGSPSGLFYSLRSKVQRLPTGLFILPGLLASLKGEVPPTDLAQLERKIPPRPESLFPGQD